MSLLPSTGEKQARSHLVNIGECPSSHSEKMSQLHSKGSAYYMVIFQTESRSEAPSSLQYSIPPVLFSNAPILPLLRHPVPCSDSPIFYPPVPVRNIQATWLVENIIPAAMKCILLCTGEVVLCPGFRRRPDWQVNKTRSGREYCEKHWLDVTK